MSTRAMTVTTTLRRLTFDEALEVVELGGAFVDLRPTADYLDAHVPGSLDIVYEDGPGMAARARDCLPLGIPYVLLDLGHGDPSLAAGALRGRGFDVAGAVEDGLNRWAAGGRLLGSTEVLTGERVPDGTLLHVSDPGAVAPEGAVTIPADDLWPRCAELDRTRRAVVVAGYGVRAGLAVGILERNGFEDVAFWRSGPARRPIV
jgi:rhodanese-related sulfurtransferase